ncbi:MAG: hypothetical protein EXS36_04380 [Pedosphaera sp.]|nr:hypothetical protein [Pedosphaera sp.]
MPQILQHRVVDAAVYLLPVRTRMPLKFGHESLTEVTCVRVRLRLTDPRGEIADGWGETPLSVQWSWPGSRPFAPRLGAMIECCRRLARAWVDFPAEGHAFDLGHDFLEQVLPGLWRDLNRSLAPTDAGTMPWLAALICNSAFDLALHDACGHLLNRPIYQTYTGDFLKRELSEVLIPNSENATAFREKFPADFLLPKPLQTLAAWHLVGGLDPLDEGELSGSEPVDEHPVLLADWIQRDGLKCLKVKLRGNDSDWDYRRMVQVGRIGRAGGVNDYSADFNCTVRDPAYVCEILDHLERDEPELFSSLLYVEQPFPYELEEHSIDVRAVSRRKPLFLDESAHDWRLVRLGLELGWTGVALKTCKTQTGALLSACWARAHGMQIMVQDLTNPMLAQIPHCLLAANVGTIRGVETNAMQFYPAASEPEAVVHPGLYRRQGGCVELDSISGPGFGYRLNDISRKLPQPIVEYG